MSDMAGSCKVRPKTAGDVDAVVKIVQGPLVM